eukprot:CAMPEP_0172487580 /NCGR_PEP_ID=MMETSP1066-20121228/16718_1 /TAXON_ID=671091 /ORGANISM="Coscinodiscus wailesii, Strain CCMP2513" /LENGTH=412 /DNA_ID=CAMNT_0013254277 /DNA_START=59 /DNA_END=1297 /DNA_ORIENTATION=+
METRKYPRIYVACGVLFILALSSILNDTLLTKITTNRNLGNVSKGLFGSLHMKYFLIPDDIEVPSDMWRYPTESWQPVKLPNCCDKDIAESAQFHKKPFRCLSEKDTLRYYGPGMGLTPDDLRIALRASRGDLVLMGDSMTRQWFEQLSCYLGGYDKWQGYAAAPIEDNREILEERISKSLMKSSPLWKKRGTLAQYLMADSVSGFGAFDIPRSIRGEPSQKVLYHNTNSISLPEFRDLVTYYNEVYRHTFHREKPIIVINIGMHYNRDTPNLNEGKLRNHVHNLAKHCRDIGARCIFRETSPQHFDTPAGDGLYMKNAPHQKCMSQPPESFSTLNQWRNAVRNDVVKEVGSGKHGFVKLMPLFDQLAGLNMAHTPKLLGNDCTHFAGDPGFWEPWHLSLIEVLMDVITDVM